MRRALPIVLSAALVGAASGEAAAASTTTLRVSRFGATPASVQAGSAITLKGRVVNRASRTLSGRLTVTLRARSGVRTLRSAALARTKAGRTRSFALRLTVPAAVKPAAYTLRVCARRAGGTSHCRSHRIRITAKPAAAPAKPVTPVTPVTPAATASAATPTPAPAPGTALPSLRPPLTGENFYFVMPDRFQNGTTANDTGGIPGDLHTNGFDPTKKGYYHGGDLRGLLSELDYIKGLGTTAIWLTPSFKNRAVQGVGANESAGYHGYWITDFTQIDPHLGTNQDLKNVIDAAHAKGMKVFFDIITNHTADVINKDVGHVYVTKDAAPYRTAAGTVFDDRDFADRSTFPALDPATSFPVPPVFATPADATLKVPAWLNDPTLYHNRGDTTFTGEDSQYGDFFGLDDLFTEQPRVVDGMIDIYDTWVRDMKIDGFRIDTMKHVNDEFWQRFSPSVLDYAKSQGVPNFFMFGEVADSTRPLTSHYMTHDNVQAVLDFPFRDGARGFASRSQATDGLRDLFVGDDWYTDADSNAYQLPTFLGNHDDGRIGLYLRTDNPTAPESELLARDKLAHALMYFSRGNPVVYYGDEQGFTGTGGDQAARQDMFPSQDLEYDNLGDDAGKNDDIGSDVTPMADNFDPTHPLYRAIRELADVTKAEPALRNGAMQSRWSDSSAGIYAFSRWTHGEEREYVVALNNAGTAKTADVPTFMSSATFTKVYGEGDATLRSAADRKLRIALPPLSAVVYKALGTIPRSTEAPSVAVVEPAYNGSGSDRMQVRADVGGDSDYEVTFWAKVGDDPWAPIGTDDNAPYRVFHDVGSLAPGTAVTYQAVVSDNDGHSRASAYRAAQVGPPAITWDLPAAGARVRGAVTLRAFVAPDRSDYSVTFQRRIGDGAWTSVGTDDSSPAYMAFDTLPALATGTAVTYRAVVDYGNGTVTSTERSVTVAPPPVTQAIIHFQRAANDSVVSWGLHLFGDGLAPGQATADYSVPTPFEATDAFGVSHTVGIADDTKPVGFVIHGMPPDINTKDTPLDRHFTPATCPEIWVKQGDTTIYCAQPAR